MREQLDASTGISAQDLVRAQYDRERLSRGVATLLTERVDVLLLPTMAVTAPPIGAKTVEVEGVVVPVTMAMASFTLLQNLTRMPTVAVPVGLGPDGLPTSVQVTAPSGADALALRVAHALEESVWPQAERWPGKVAAARE